MKNKKSQITHISNGVTKIISIACFLMIMVGISSQARGSQTGKLFPGDALSHPSRTLKNFKFDPSSSVVSRIQAAPTFILSKLKAADNCSNYTSYIPSGKEMKLFNDYLKLLPPANINVLQTSVVGIYFVKGFNGGSMIDWIVDDKGNLYTYMVFNSKVLSMDITDFLSNKEMTCFESEKKTMSMEIYAGKKYKGLIYTLLHESTHAVDAMNRITPFVFPSYAKMVKTPSDATPFTEDVWNHFNETVEDYDISHRKNIAYYKDAPIEMAETLMMYMELEETPFVSMNAGISWSDDIAETVTFFHLTKVLKQPYEVRIKLKGTLLESYNLAESDCFQKRVFPKDTFYGKLYVSKK